MKSQSYDIIGDVHGCAVELQALLEKMGYSETHGVYRHPEGRKGIFLGDFIDRGPEIPRVLEISKSMCNAGTAIAVLGNHEYNAICFHTRHRSEDSWLRPHTPSKVHQHQATLDAFSRKSDDWQMYMSWFRTLPMYLNLEGLNIIHACWDSKRMDLMERKYGHAPLMDDSFLHVSSDKKTEEFAAVEILLKGKEAPLPKGLTVPDKEGIHRSQVRTKWWLSEQQLDSSKSVLDIALSVPEGGVELLKDLPFEKEQFPGAFVGLPQESITLVGHYWFNGKPKPINEQLACLDYSCVKGGSLTAYQWDGEASLDKSKFVSVDAV